MEYLVSLSKVLLLFSVGIIAFRLMGSQSVGRLTDFDLVVVIAIGALIGDSLADPELNVWIIIVAIAGLVMLQIVTSMLAMKFPWLERWVMGNPIKLIENGNILFRGLRRARLTRKNLEQELRVKGLTDLEQIQHAYMEPNGKLSVIEKKQSSGTNEKST